MQVKPKEVGSAKASIMAKSGMLSGVMISPYLSAYCLPVSHNPLPNLGKRFVCLFRKTGSFDKAKYLRVTQNLMHSGSKNGHRRLDFQPSIGHLIIGKQGIAEPLQLYPDNPQQMRIIPQSHIVSTTRFNRSTCGFDVTGCSRSKWKDSNEVVELSPFTLSFALTSFTACDQDSYEYSANTAECLNPTRSIRWQPPMLDPVSNCAGKQPKRRAAYQQPPDGPDAGQLHALWHFKSLHVQWLLATLFPESLPSHRQHVQPLATVVAVERPARPSSLPDARPAGVRRV